MWELGLSSIAKCSSSSSWVVAVVVVVVVELLFGHSIIIRSVE